MKLTFRKSLDHLDESICENCMCLLLLNLASIIYHRMELHQFHCESPNHSFSSLSVLYHQELLDDLSKLITTENSSSTISLTTPRTRALKSFHEVINLQGKKRDNKDTLMIHTKM